MTIAALYPRREYAGVAEQHAAWQSQMRLRRDADVAEIVYYDEDEAARDVVDDGPESHLLVVLDPLVIVEPGLAARMRSELGQHPGDAVLVPAQSDAEPLLYFCAAETLRKERRSLRRALDGREVVPTHSIVVRKWQPIPEPDLLPYIPNTIRSLLHVGCGEGALGREVKQRQRCRVVGIETDRELASAAKRRIDDIYIGDIAEIVSILGDRFDCIVCSGIAEQTADPWSLFAELRRLATPDAILVTAIPNVTHARVISGLLEGRFDMARQIRFFTRASVEELIDIAGWKLEAIHSVTEPVTTTLQAAHDDLFTTAFVVIARA